MDYVGGGCESEVVPLCLLNLHFPGGCKKGAGRTGVFYFVQIESFYGEV